MTVTTKLGAILAFLAFGLVSFAAKAAVPCATENECNKQLMALLPGAGPYTSTGHQSPGLRKRGASSTTTHHYKAVFSDMSTAEARKQEGHPGSPDIYHVFYTKDGNMATIASIEHRRIDRHTYKTIKTYGANEIAQLEQKTLVARRAIPAGGNGAVAKGDGRGIQSDRHVATVPKAPTTADCDAKRNFIEKMRCHASLGIPRPKP